MSYFDTHGPYEVQRPSGIITGAQQAFWNSIPSKYASPEHAIGCYVFGIRYGAKIRPWYVGMTVAKAGFRGEIFQKHKLDIYNECMNGRRGTPVMFLFPLITSGMDAFSTASKSKKKEIAWLEITLVGFAFRQNPELSNVRDMTFLKNVEVLGLLGKRRGRPYREAQEVRKMLLGKRISN